MKPSRPLFAVFAALTLSALFTAFAPQAAEAQSGKIAVVDLQRAINETADGKNAKAELKKIFESRQKGLDKKQEELKKLKEQIEQQKNVLSREALETKVESYQKQLVELQQVYVDYQRELAEKEGEKTKVIIQRMEKILQDLGKSEGYALVIERNEAGVIFVPSHLDLTDRLIQLYNAGKWK
jgi:outer membrane protein